MRLDAIVFIAFTVVLALILVLASIACVKSAIELMQPIEYETFQEMQARVDATIREIEASNERVRKARLRIIQ